MGFLPEHHFTTTKKTKTMMMTLMMMVMKMKMMNADLVIFMASLIHALEASNLTFYRSGITVGFQEAIDF